MATVVILSSAETLFLGPILAGAGHRVIEADDSDDVWRLLAGHRVDMVVLPVAADPVDWEEHLPAIRRHTNAFIVAVGDANETRMATAIVNGADAYYQIPFDINILLARLSRPLRAT